MSMDLSYLSKPRIQVCASDQAARWESIINDLEKLRLTLLGCDDLTKAADLEIDAGNGLTGLAKSLGKISTKLRFQKAVSDVDEMIKMAGIIKSCIPQDPEWVRDIMAGNA